ncbi:RidA family protein [Methylobacterium pseudosasicola]|uniref:Enamine deaminase RidA, house cleaning of reactive enamine intermediates, YjgF/YER057c/UK114 family n=1 Tax=Methylobacterium pseudosasicola TaxID=582667 RepID=A0A1I4NK38_9HYPH|nr:RidA family protein [Methylobacterium pseudosasicola]SFM15884.1 Enamine deaminase RidA, house cleaning of reactive enamine intermediates, YjgF/YER057c/UK114 family [Methylobacterium pseudosasicola]
MTSVVERLEAAGLRLPQPNPPNGVYVPFTRAGSLVFLAGATPMRDGELLFPGTVGASLSLEDGKQAAAVCALNLLANLGLACDSDFGRVRAVKVNGYVRCSPDFTQQPRVIDGASEIFRLALGERGDHARAAVGVLCLPRGACVEVEAIFEMI